MPAPTQRQAILAAIDARTDEMVDSLVRAIRIPSINPKYPGQRFEEHIGRESEANEVIADIYRRAGAEVEMVERERGRANACARIRGTGAGRSLLLNSHIDVVPAERTDRWDYPPFAGIVADGKVHGRGATDAKGGVIAAAYAAVALKDAGVHLKGDVILQSVVGEETGDHHAGTSACLEAGYTADAAIVCEPSSFDEGAPHLVPTTPGLLWFTLTIDGKAAHSGMRGLTIHPTLENQNLGVNTVDAYWPIYHALRRLEDKWAVSDRHPLFKNGQFGILPGVVSASPMGIGVPFFLADTMTVEYCIYHHPERTNAEVKDEIQRAIHSACSLDPWLSNNPPIVTWQSEWPPYSTPVGHPLLEVVSRAHSWAVGSNGVDSAPPQQGFLGVCDMTWIKELDIDGIIYGPGVGHTAHAENEYVTVEEVIIATKTLALAIADFCEPT